MFSKSIGASFRCLEQRVKIVLSTLPKRHYTLQSTSALIGVSLSIGFAIGRLTSVQDEKKPERVLPSGLPRTCCDEELTDKQHELLIRLARIVGPENFLDGRKENTLTLPFLTGARLGRGGKALAIITPRTLQDVVKCVELIVNANCVIIPQGSNTGLTGGSVPRVNTGDKRPVVIISMKHLDAFFPIDGGKRVVCLAGAGLAALSRDIPTWFPDRETHSTLGSTFLNPTTAAGVALGSGGTQLRKGPAYTDRALYIKVWRNEFGENVVDVINNLGIDGLEDKESCEKNIVLKKFDNYQLAVKQGHSLPVARSSNCQHGTSPAHDVNYAHHVCQHDNNVSRYNADCSGSECNRSEGKVLILATVHDTFPRPLVSQTFWLSFQDLETALEFRRDVCLHNAHDLPISVEYMDRDTFDVIDQAGRVMANVIKLVGVSSSLLRSLWNGKLWVEALPFSGAPQWCDKLLFMLNSLFPSILPFEVMDMGRKMDHHVVLTVGEFGDGNLNNLLNRLQSFTLRHGKEKVWIHELRSKSDVLSSTAFRFIAGPAFRTWCVGNGAQGISVDYALPKNCCEIPQLSSIPIKRMRFSHFGCNVVHEALAFIPGFNVHGAKAELQRIVEKNLGGKLPAEHGHGIEYIAPTETQERWKRMDPLNVFNPGVGGLSSKERYT
jgi:D-lactate dehydrogenase (quinone)